MMLYREGGFRFVRSEVVESVNFRSIGLAGFSFDASVLSNIVSVFL